MGFYSSHISKSYPAVTMKHLDYIERKNNFKNLPDLVYSESGNLPPWAKDERDYWQTVSDYEREREEAWKNGEVGYPSYSVRKLIFALPNEMTKEEMIDFTHKFLEENFRDYPYTFVIHEKESAVHGISNPHVHLLFSDYQNSERTAELDQKSYFKPHGISKSGKEYGGAARNREYSAMPSRRYWLTRKNLADSINAWYKEKGIDKKVSEKSLKDQKLEALNTGNFLDAEILKREKPFRLSPKKFQRYKRVIQEKVKAGWRNIKDLDDIKDPEVRNRIIQELEKQQREEMSEILENKATPSSLDRLNALEDKINEIELIEKYVPTWGSTTSRLNQLNLKELHREADSLRLRMEGNEDSHYFMTMKYESEISDILQNRYVVQLSGLSIQEKIQEYATADFTIQEMRKEMNRLAKRKENGVLLEKMPPDYKVVTKQLIRKIDSKESLIRYRHKIGKGTADLEEDIRELEIEIDGIANTALTPEERKAVSDEYGEIQKEIYHLREVSSAYEYRIKESDPDGVFRSKYHEKIRKYTEYLTRLKDNDISLAPDNEGKSFHASRKEVIDNTVLKRVEILRRAIDEEQSYNWKTALKSCINETTDNTYDTLQEEYNSLLLEWNAIPHDGGERCEKLRNDIDSLRNELADLRQKENGNWQKNAKVLLKNWRKDRTSRISAMKELIPVLAKDSRRKHLDPKIRKMAKAVLKEAAEKIGSFGIRKSASRFEEERIEAINRKVENITQDFLVQYENYRPHTENYFAKILIDQEYNRILSTEKEKLEKAEKDKRFKLLANPKADVYLEDRTIQQAKANMGRIFYTYLTPEIMVKVADMRNASIREFRKHRVELTKEHWQVRKFLKYRHLEPKMRKKVEGIISYTGGNLSRQKLLEDTVIDRVQDFRKKVMVSIPRKESWYVRRIIDEKYDHFLTKQDKQIRTIRKLVRILQKEHPEMEEKIANLTEQLEQAVKERDRYLVFHTTSDIQQQAAQRRNEAIANWPDMQKQLRQEYKSVLKDSALRTQPKTIRARNSKAMGRIRILIDAAGKANFERSHSDNMDRLAKGAQDMMNHLEGLLGKTIGRANVRTTDQGRE